MARPAKRVIEYKVCIGECKKKKQVDVNFYSSNSPLFPDGRVSICKSCIQKDLDVTDLNSVKRVLRQLDKPFIPIEWQSCLNSGKEPFGWYLRKISGLHQYNSLTYEDSVEGKVDNHKYKTDNDLITEEDIYDKPTIEVIRKWGTSYSPKEYYELENLWDEMVTSNDISTPQHKKQLKYYCQMSILLDRAIDSNDEGKIGKLNKEFLEIQKNSGFRPIDRVSGSDSSGIRNFGTIFEEVERDGFIEPPEMEFKQDIIDQTIVYLANYTRKLLNMEQLISVPDDAPKVGEDE